MPGLQGANWYGYLTPEITGHRDIYDAAMSETEVEYRIWRYQKWIKSTGCTASTSTIRSPPSAPIPMRDWATSSICPTGPSSTARSSPASPGLGMRDFLKRLHTVIHRRRDMRPYIWLHGTDTFVIGAYSFADFVLDGENAALHHAGESVVLGKMVARAHADAQRFVEVGLWHRHARRNERIHRARQRRDLAAVVPRLCRLSRCSTTTKPARYRYLDWTRTRPEAQGRVPALLGSGGGGGAANRQRQGLCQRAGSRTARCASKSSTAAAMPRKDSNSPSIPRRSAWNGPPAKQLVVNDLEEEITIRSR